MAGFGDAGSVLGAVSNCDAAESVITFMAGSATGSVITCMAGFVCAGHPQPPGGRIVIPASLSNRTRFRGGRRPPSGFVAATNLNAPGL